MASDDSTCMVIGIKPESVECRNLFQHSQQLRYGYSHVDIDHKKAERDIKEDVVQNVTNIGNAPNISDNNNLFNSCSVKGPPQEDNAIENYKYGACNKYFATKTNHNVHMKRHNASRNKCEFCDKSFATKQYMLQHAEVHANEQAYKCEICKKCYATKKYRC